MALSNASGDLLSPSFVVFLRFPLEISLVVYFVTLSAPALCLWFTFVDFKA